MPDPILKPKTVHAMRMVATSVQAFSVRNSVIFGDESGQGRTDEEM